MKVFKTTLPGESLLNDPKIEYGFTDSYQSEIDNIEGNLTSAEVGRAFFSSSPTWVGKLFDFRNRIASVFGLKTTEGTAERAQKLESFKCEPGEQLGLFKVFARNDHEVILGEDDKHLDFRVSLFLQKQKDHVRSKELTISTAVVFHNRFGRLYFTAVRPFHQLIVPRMLKGIVKELGAGRKKAASSQGG